MSFEDYIETYYDIDFKNFKEEFNEEARKKIYEKYKEKLGE